MDIFGRDSGMALTVTLCIYSIVNFFLLLGFRCFVCGYGRHRPTEPKFEPREKVSGLGYDKQFNKCESFFSLHLFPIKNHGKHNRKDLMRIGELPRP